jgi:hypothetical protein
MRWISVLAIAALSLSGCQWFDRQDAQDKAGPAPAAATSMEKAVAAEKPALDSSSDAAVVPEDVRTFVARREGCDHFRGEEAYDEERGRFIRENLEELCTGTDAQLAALKEKYANDKGVIAKLSGFEETIE